MTAGLSLLAGLVTADIGAFFGEAAFELATTQKVLNRLAKLAGPDGTVKLHLEGGNLTATAYDKNGNVTGVGTARLLTPISRRSFIQGMHDWGNSDYSMGN